MGKSRTYLTMNVFRIAAPFVFVWDYIEINSENKEATNAIFAIMNIKADEMKINKLCKGIMNNTALFEYYFVI